MDYKKKYDEALERAAGLITRENKDIAEYIFPELKENKNEVMINEIIAYLDAQDALTKGKDIDFKNWIAWLRKQSEITPTEDELESLRIAAYEPVKNWSKELQSLYEKLKYCNKNNNKSLDCVSIVDYNGEKWVRVCGLGEDFLIASHDYKDGDKKAFTWEEACKIGTFTKKQIIIALSIINEINSKLNEIGGDKLTSYYWSSTECGSNIAWYVYFGGTYSSSNYKTYSNYVRAVVNYNKLS